jgi:hypothetical protein
VSPVEVDSVKGGEMVMELDPPEIEGVFLLKLSWW